ncbi:MAG: DUF6900 domain-containing protein [Fimbriiglobus sp.]
MTTLEHIAQKHLNLYTLTPTRFEKLGVYTVTVRAIAAALQEAYDLGCEFHPVGDILDQLLGDIMDSDDPSFTPAQVAFLQDRIEKITSFTPFQTL